MDGGTLRTVAVFADPLSVSANNVGAVSPSSTLTTFIANATVTGGLTPHSYSWQLINNGGGTASFASAPLTASTRFTKYNVPPDTTYIDTWRVTVTDSVGNTATADVTASFYNSSSLS